MFFNICVIFIVSLYQDNANTFSVAAVKEQLRQLLCATRPSVLLSCRPAQASDVKVSGGVMPDASILKSCHTRTPCRQVCTSLSGLVIVCSVLQFDKTNLNLYFLY